MEKGMLIIKCAHHYLYQTAYPCDTKPADFELRSDYDLSQPTGHSHRYNAIVEISFDSLGQPMAIEVNFLSEEHEPQQEQVPLQVDDIPDLPPFDETKGTLNTQIRRVLGLDRHAE